LRQEYYTPNAQKYQNLGKFSIQLLKANEQSAYRLLYQKDDFINLNRDNTKSIRNNTLKKLAETNDELFPMELRSEKLKKKVELTYEGK
jgi:hypothetical protein